MESTNTGFVLDYSSDSSALLLSPLHFGISDVPDGLDFAILAFHLSRLLFVFAMIVSIRGLSVFSIEVGSAPLPLAVMLSALPPFFEIRELTSFIKGRTMYSKNPH